MDQYFYPFIRLLSVFFLFFCQDTSITRSNCSVIGCNLSKKHKLTLCKRQNGEPIYVDNKFFFNFCWELPTQKLRDRHPNTTKMVRWLVQVLCELKATWHQEASLPLEYTIKIQLADIFYLISEIPSSTFLLHFRYIYFLLCILRIQIW